MEAKDFLDLLQQKSNLPIIAFLDDYTEQFGFNAVGETLQQIHESAAWERPLVEYEEADGSGWFTTPIGSRQMIQRDCFWWSVDGSKISYELETLPGYRRSATIKFSEEP